MAKASYTAKFSNLGPSTDDTHFGTLSYVTPMLVRREFLVYGNVRAGFSHLLLHFTPMVVPPSPPALSSRVLASLRLKIAGTPIVPAIVGEQLPVMGWVDHTSARNKRSLETKTWNGNDMIIIDQPVSYASGSSPLSEVSRSSTCLPSEGDQLINRD